MKVQATYNDAKTEPRRNTWITLTNGPQLARRAQGLAE
jgi:hypothetical protein